MCTWLMVANPQDWLVAAEGRHPTANEGGRGSRRPRPSLLRDVHERKKLRLARRCEWRTAAVRDIIAVLSPFFSLPSFLQDLLSLSLSKHNFRAHLHFPEAV